MEEQIEMKSGLWSEAEHNAFLEGIEALGVGKWKEIAEQYVKSRTGQQVADRYKALSRAAAQKEDKTINTGKWSEAEHNAFLEGIKALGVSKWKEIAEQYVKTRNAMQVLGHYNALSRVAAQKEDKTINTGKWSAAEHNAFLEGIKALGVGKWKEIAEQYVKTRNGKQVNNRYHALSRVAAKKEDKTINTMTNGSQNNGSMNASAESAEVAGSVSDVATGLDWNEADKSKDECKDSSMDSSTERLEVVAGTGHVPQKFHLNEDDLLIFPKQLKRKRSSQLVVAFRVPDWSEKAKLSQSKVCTIPSHSFFALYHSLTYLCFHGAGGKAWRGHPEPD